MKKNISTIITLLFCSLGFSQEVNVQDKAKALQYRILTQHALTKEWNDSLSKNVHALLIDFLDPNRIYFSKEQVDLLNQKSILIAEDIKQRNTKYLDEVKTLFISELSLFQNFLLSESQNPIAIKNDITPQVPYSFTEFCSSKELPERRKRYMQQQVFSTMYQMHDKTDILPLDDLKKDEEAARKKIIDRRNQLTNLFTEDNRFIDDYYLQAIAMAFDPHTLYFTESQMNSFKDELSVEQERFGFSYGLNTSNKIIITKLLPGSSAWLSGKIKENSVLVEVGLKLNKEWVFTELSEGLVGLNQLQELLKPYNEKEIQLVLENENNGVDKVHLIKTKILNDNELVKNVLLGQKEKIGYIQLPDFYMDMTGSNFGNGCANDIAKCILKLKKDSIRGLILDLRGNGGGSLKEAIELAGIFIDYGPVMAIQDRTGMVTTLKDVNRGYIYDDPLIILIDQGSASASEIVSATLQDYGKALIVGRNSFGKATSQQIMPIDPAAAMGLTSRTTFNSNFGFVNVTEGILYRINSQSNQLEGVKPDIYTPTEFDLFESKKEKDLSSVIQAPTLTKKINYTHSNKIPKNELIEWSESYFSSQFMQNEISKRASIKSNLLSEDILYLDYSAYFSALKKVEKRIELLVEDFSYFELSEIQSNSFDKKLYEQNEVLRTFQNDFQKELSSDLELKFAFDLMNKWLSSLN